jgi:hypothetical protein
MGPIAAIYAALLITAVQPEGALKGGAVNAKVSGIATPSARGTITLRKRADSIGATGPVVGIDTFIGPEPATQPACGSRP